MSPIDNVGIILNDGKMFYHPGDQVNGDVYIRLSKSFTIRQVIVRFYGEGHSQYYKHKVQYDYTQPIFQYQYVAYDMSNEAVYQGARGNFAPGDYWFPFSCKLPEEDVPSSYHDYIAKIRYWFDAYVDNSKKRATATIIVVESVNVNTEQLQQSLAYNDEQTIQCCCVKGGTINVSGKIAKRGFYPGEVVHAEFNVENHSNREVTYTEMILKQRVRREYGEDEDNEATTKKTLTSIKGMGVPAGKEADITGMDLQLPNDLSPSTSVKESIVRISYQLILVAHVKGACTSAIRMKFEITIGFMSGMTTSESGLNRIGSAEAASGPVNTTTRGTTEQNEKL